MSPALFLVKFAHLLVSSTLVFLAVALVMEISLAALRIKEGRTRAVCRSLLILKLPFDVLIYQFFLKGYFINLNSFSCKTHFETFLISHLPVKDAQTLACFFESIFPSFILFGLPFVIILVFAIKSGSKILKLLKANLFLKKICRSAKPYFWEFSNTKLSSALKKLKIKIRLSDQTFSPFATQKEGIILPATLIEKLNEEELEAVIAHELEHIRWKDPYLKVILSWISTFFWWLPLNWWLKKIESDQEKACDKSIDTYEISNQALASAVVKTIHQMKDIKFQERLISCAFASHKASMIDRLKAILETAPFASKTPLFSYVLGTSLACISLVFFWIC